MKTFVESAEVERIRDRVRAAAADGRPLRIQGGGTKDFYGEAFAGDPLDVRALRGIVTYEPAELVVKRLRGDRSPGPLAEPARV